MQISTNKNPWKTIILLTCIAGILDLTAASIQAWISGQLTPDQLLAYIASGVWGEEAFQGGYEMLLFGLLIHFTIVFACVFCFFWVYPKWPFLQLSISINAFLIGIIAWTITTQMVIPLSRIPTQEFNLLNALLAIFILIVCIGFPIALGAQRFYR